MPTTAALGVVGALHGADAVHALLDFLPPSLLDALPAATEVKSFYEAHGAAVDVGLDSVASLAAVLFAFVVMPLGDLVFGQEPEAELPPPSSKSKASSPSSSSASSSSSLSSSSSSPFDFELNPYRGWLWAFAFLHLSALAAGAAAAPGMHLLPLIGAALSLGTSGANAFTCAHELGHSRLRQERALADLLLAAQLLPHWRTAHAAHHRNVGLPGDPETALLGEGFWEFLPRAVRGGFRDAMRSDAARSRARAAKEAREKNENGGGDESSSFAAPLSSFDLLRHSNMPRWAASAAAAVAVAAALGSSSGAGGFGGEGVGGGGSAAAAAAAAAALALFGTQAAFAVLWLEAAEYIEHFGLSRSSPLVRRRRRRRKKKKTKTRKTRKTHPFFPSLFLYNQTFQEKVQPFHSWNANFALTNAVTFRLQRHSDHHAHGKEERERERASFCFPLSNKRKKNSLFFPFRFFSSPFSLNTSNTTAEKSFETLRDEPDAPQLPASYPVMMVTAVAFPALFRRVMEPRALAEQAKNEARRGRTKSKRKESGGGENGGGSVVVR